MKILVVDDEAAIRQNLERLLSLEGYEVLCAAGGREALALAQSASPDLVLTDVSMPDLDGMALMAHLRADVRTATVPVILLTARVEPSQIREGMRAGADDYLTKPFQREELIASVKAQLDKAQRWRENQIRMAQDHRRWLHIDPDTQLPNRRLLSTLVESELALGRQPALLVLSFDRMDWLVEQYGPSCRKAVLLCQSERLRALMRERKLHSSHDLLAMLNDRELAIMLAQPGQMFDLREWIGRLNSEVKRPVEHAGREHFVTPVMGLALSDEFSMHAETLLVHAQSALDSARRDGSTYTCYDREQADNHKIQLELHYDLYRAVERQEIHVFYQPQMHVDGHLLGFEALARWQHRKHGWVSPATFIPLAEENRQIIELGREVLRQACSQLSAWRREGYAGWVAVNLSAVQFHDPDLIDTVAQQLVEHDLPPSCLELEITEGTAMSTVPHTLQTLQRLKELGVRLALDDFGTGYSSLAYLKRFPLDLLKLDQSFVKRLPDDRNDAAIARAICQLGSALEMDVLAEGVETPEQARFLGEIGCSWLQGFLYAKPMPAEEAGRWWRRYPVLPVSALGQDSQDDPPAVLHDGALSSGRVRLSALTMRNPSPVVPAPGGAEVHGLDTSADPAWNSPPPMPPH